MGWRWMDNLTGRMNGPDPMHQFDSDYVGLGNNPVARIDPDGRIAPLVIAGAALVGGGINLISNWSKVKGDWRAGTAYFLSGAVGGVVGLSNVYAGGAITSGANAAIDIATGNMPQLNSIADKAGYVAQGAVIGLGTAVIGSEVGKLIGPQISKVFNWTQTGFANATQQTVQIGGQAYTYFMDAGVKLSKSWFGSVGAQVGSSLGSKIEANALRRLSEMEGATSGAHFLSRHGAGTTLAQQEIRALTGLTPDGFAGKPVDASRFLNNQIELQAAQRAETIFKQTGKSVINFNMGNVVGEGYLKGTSNLIRTSEIRAVFKNGKLYTMFPKLK